MHVRTLPNSIFDDPIANLLSILCILIEIFSHANGGGGGGGGGGEFVISNLELLLVVLLDGTESVAVTALKLSVWILGFPAKPLVFNQCLVRR